MFGLGKTRPGGGGSAAMAGEVARWDADGALWHLGSRRTGLSETEAATRQRMYGDNRITQAPRTPLWRRLLQEFGNFFARVLWAAAALAFLAESQTPGQGMRELGFAIVAVILINGVFSFWQVQRAAQALAALQALLPQQVTLLRDGHCERRDSVLLVPGDVIWMGTDDPTHVSTVSSYPVVQARIDPYFLSKFEITQHQWAMLGGGNPSTCQMAIFGETFWPEEFCGPTAPGGRVVL